MTLDMIQKQCYWTISELGLLQLACGLNMLRQKVGACLNYNLDILLTM